MNRRDIVFPHETPDNFIRRCMENEFNTDLALVDRVAAESSSVEEFIDNFLAHDEAEDSQFYNVLLKYERPAGVWHYILSRFGDRCVKTESDVGSLKIGCGSFQFFVPNGKGDGTTRFAVVGKSFPCSDLMTFCGSMAGEEINVYSYDCGDSVAVTLSGEYLIYSYKGLIALVPITNEKEQNNEET